MLLHHRGALTVLYNPNSELTPGTTTSMERKGNEVTVFTFTKSFGDYKQ